MESTPGVGSDTAPGVLDEPGLCGIPDTISTACSSVVAKRLTNPAEQQYIGRLLPDMLRSVTAALPRLNRPKALVIGDAMSTPSLIAPDLIAETPIWGDIDIHIEWKKDPLSLEFDRTTRWMRKDEGEIHIKVGGRKSWWRRESSPGAVANPKAQTSPSR